MNLLIFDMEIVDETNGAFTIVVSSDGVNNSVNAWKILLYFFTCIKNACFY